MGDPRHEFFGNDRKIHGQRKLPNVIKKWSHEIHRWLEITKQIEPTSIYISGIQIINYDMACSIQTAKSLRKSGSKRGSWLVTRPDFVRCGVEPAPPSVADTISSYNEPQARQDMIQQKKAWNNLSEQYDEGPNLNTNTIQCVLYIHDKHTYIYIYIYLFFMCIFITCVFIYIYIYVCIYIYIYTY